MLKFFLIVGCVFLISCSKPESFSQDTLSDPIIEEEYKTGGQKIDFEASIYANPEYAPASDQCGRECDDVRGLINSVRDFFIEPGQTEPDRAQGAESYIGEYGIPGQNWQTETIPYKDKVIDEERRQQVYEENDVIIEGVAASAGPVEARDFLQNEYRNRKENFLKTSTHEQSVLFQSRTLKGNTSLAVDAHNAATKSILESFPEATDQKPIRRNQSFHTDAHSVEGKLVRRASAYAQYVETQINSRPESNQTRAAAQLVAGAEVGIELADQDFAQGNFEDGQIALDISTKLLDLGLSLTPGVGWGKDVYEAVTGRNLLTDAELDTWDRTFAVIGVVTAGVGSKIGKAPKALAVLGDVIKASDKGEDAVRALSKAENIFDSAKKFEVSGARLGKLMGDMREWIKTRGNFGMGSGKRNEADFLGESWVGPGAIKKDYPGNPGKSIYVSKDGSKQYREPVWKPRDGKNQANYEWREGKSGPFLGDGHFEIIE